MAKNLFRVDFSVDNISLKEQQDLFNKVVDALDYNGRQNLHITVTDRIGGQHKVWDNTGVDPDGDFCKKCINVDCAECEVYLDKERSKDGE